MGKRNGSSFEVGGLPLWGMFAAGAALLMIAVFTLANLPEPRATGAQPAPVSTYTFPSSEPTSVNLPVAVVGDSFTGGSGQDSGQAARWPANLAGFDVTTYHEGGTGYAATLDTADGPSNFVTRVEQMPSDGIDKLVFFGSINDGRLGYDATRAAAETALGEARSKWPDARILVIGPASPRWPVPTEFIDARNATRDAAEQEGLTFVDPIELGWFDGTQNLIGSDNTHPNDDGHAYLAERMQIVLDENFTP